MSSAPSWTVRSLGEEDWDAFARVDAHAFGASAPDELLTAEQATLETERHLGVHDGDELVGIATAYSFDLAVPGAQLAAAGVTWVGVLPTHRRRGVLSALMSHQLEQMHERGREPLAVLWASEPAIYGRYGYGCASRFHAWNVPRSNQALRPDAPHDPSVRLRLVDPPEAAHLAPVYEALAQRRAGVPARDQRWWDRAVRDLPSMREGRSPLRCVLAEDARGVRGYALYTTKQNFDDDFGKGTVAVREVVGSDPAALAAVYRFLFDLDLMGSTSLWNVPVDDPLQHWLRDPRGARPSLHDALYARLVDVGPALAGRTYASEVDVVVAVSDERCPWNAGRWRLAGDGTGATCGPTTDEADLELDVADLGAVSLGGTRLGELAAAGRVQECTPGALAVADRAFAATLAPWSPAVF